MNAQEHVQHFQELTRQHPRFPDVWHKLGLSLVETGQFEDALEAFTQALVIHPQYTDAAVSRCFALVELGKNGEAFAEFRRVSNRNPDGFEVVLALGILCMRAGWRCTGFGQLERAVSLKPNLPFARGLLAAAYLELGREDESRREVGRMRRTLQGLNIECLTQYAKSSESADPSLLGSWRDPALVRIPVLLAHDAAMNGDVSKATKLLQAANLRFPGSSELMVEMGKVLHSAGQDDRAMEWLSGAVCVDPQSNRAYFEASFIHASRGNLGQAAEVLRKAVTLRPLYPDYRYHLGTLLLDLEENEEAIRHLECALTVNHRYGQVRLQLARAYLSAEEPDAALQALEHDSCRDWLEAAVLSAQACVKQGRQAAAVKHYESALRMDESHAEARQGLEVLSKHAT